MDALPEIVPNWGELATTDPKSFLDLELPVAGIAGDQQSALFGQTCFDVGDSKCTFGTGSFILTNTGAEVVRSDAGLLSTAAWKSPDGEMTYALEGAIFVTGAAVQWLRDGLQIVGSAAETEAIAATVDSTDGVVFVPALTGLGAPHWDPHARGTILGITRGTTRAHIVRATLEAITFEVRDVTDTMPTELTSLMVDGGAAANDLLCQLQADLLGVPVQRPQIVETTALGAAFMAGLGTGVWESTDDLRETWKLDREFTPDESDRGQGAPRRVVRAVAEGRRALEGLDRLGVPGRTTAPDGELSVRGRRPCQARGDRVPRARSTPRTVNSTAVSETPQTVTPLPMKVAVPARAAAKAHQRTTPPRHSAAAATGMQSSRPMMPGAAKKGSAHRVLSMCSCSEAMASTP